MISLNRTEIEALIDLPAAARAIEDAYRASSRGEINLPPVGHIAFPCGGDCHIKYGHMKGDPRFVIKVATSFPANSDKGLPTGNGVVLALSAETGAVEAILHDQMMLTDIRTGLGGAIASRALARADSNRILMIGTGPQAYRQIEAHAALLAGKPSFSIWGRSIRRAEQLAEEAANIAECIVIGELEDAVRDDDIIVTATGSTSALVMSEWVAPGTHITAVGADAPGKQELDIKLVARADVLVADSTSQCLDHGEFSHVALANLIDRGNLRELGAVLDNPSLGRGNEADITIADLTGIAAQDIAIVNSTLNHWLSRDLK